MKLPLFIACLALAVSMANSGWLTSVASNNAHIVARQNAALCSFRAALGQRRDASLDYLAKHPNGAPALGVTRADILRQVQAQTATLVSLRPLACP